MPHLTAPPAIELLDRDAFVVADRNKADLAAGDKGGDEVNARTECLRGLALGQEHFQLRAPHLRVVMAPRPDRGSFPQPADSREPPVPPASDFWPASSS
jgi:hypothetical protein